MFGRPKRKPAKGVGRGTMAEETKAEFRTRQKYPQMFEEGGKGAPKKSWGGPAPKTKAKPSAKVTPRTKAVQRGMGDSAGGIKTDEEKRKGK